VAAQRGAHSDLPPPASLGENNQALDQLLAQGALAGIIEDPDSNRSPSFSVAHVDDPDAPPRPEGVVAVENPNAADRMKSFQTAMKAKTSLGQAAQGAVATSEPQEASKPAAESDGTRDTRIPVHADGDYGQFAGKRKSKRNEDDRWAMATEIENPRSRYELRAGSVIPATMISGINSELPGQIIGQVSQDVWDTPTGKYRLIPQGARLIGRYSNRIIDGQSRVLVAWQRIVFPDGKALDIGAMEGTDSAGYAGFNDKVDRHYLRIFASAALMSGIAAGLTSSSVTPDNDPFGSSSISRFNEHLANQIGEVATKMIEKNMNVAPTLVIRPGYRFNVMAVKDLAFDHAYQAFDY
jgi:type IV secretion system protein TrbI